MYNAQVRLYRVQNQNLDVFPKSPEFQGGRGLLKF